MDNTNFTSKKSSTVLIDRSEADFEMAKKFASDLLEKNGFIEPPISPIELAASEGINVVYADMPSKFSGVAGFIDMKNHIIFVNKGDPRNRQSFTIAHELGHFLMHKSLINENPDIYTVLYRSKELNDEGDPLEKEANCFAANLLVPLNLLKTYKNLPVSTLSILFQVSQQVISYRLRDFQRNNGS